MLFAIENMFYQGYIKPPKVARGHVHVTFKTEINSIYSKSPFILVTLKVLDMIYMPCSYPKVQQVNTPLDLPIAYLCIIRSVVQ